MVKFYEYFFYRMHWYYVEKMKEDIGNEILSCCFAMCLIHSLNYVFVFECIRYFILKWQGLNDFNNLNKWEYWIPATIILVCDYLYFSRKGRKERIVAYWTKASKQEKLRRDIILIIYLIVSFVLVAWIAYVIRNNLYQGTFVLDPFLIQDELKEFGIDVSP